MNSTTHNLIMTATIDVTGCPQVSRHNIDVRKNDYINCLKNYLETTNLNIIFSENSGYDLLFLKERFKEFAYRLEFISISENTAKSVGKGQGEKDTILKTLETSNILKNSKVFYKVSGRYFSPDIENVINFYDDNFYVLAREYTNAVTTVFFGCNKEIFKQYFSFKTIVSDYDQIFEIQVANMIHDLKQNHPDKIITIPSLNYQNTYVSTNVRYLTD